MLSEIAEYHTRKSDADNCYAKRTIGFSVQAIVTVPFFSQLFAQILDIRDGDICSRNAAMKVEGLIYLVRGCKVMLDEDLAVLYEIETRLLTRAVRRNRERFPEDFMFELTNQEVMRLRSQIGISNDGRGGRRYVPMVFTEQGVAMLSTVLRSPKAIQVNIEIMRTFVKLRSLILSNDHLARKLAELERRYDQQFKIVFDAIREIMQSKEPPPKRRIGF